MISNDFVLEAHNIYHTAEVRSSLMRELYKITMEAVFSLMNKLVLCNNSNVNSRLYRATVVVEIKIRRWY